MYQFVGFKELKGTSKKTGQYYHFYNCHFVCDNPRDRLFNGHETFTATLDGSFNITDLNCMLGMTVSLDFDRNGALTNISLT